MGKKDMIKILENLSDETWQVAIKYKKDNIMTREEKFVWMAVWAAKNGATLRLEGTCGFERECVGITVNNSYPDYQWYDDEYNQIDKNGEIWMPEDAYHKSPVVAVLGRGKKAENQLYEWLKWFSENRFKIEQGVIESKRKLNEIELIMGKHKYQRMVKSNT